MSDREQFVREKERRKRREKGSGEEREKETKGFLYYKTHSVVSHK